MPKPSLENDERPINPLLLVALCGAIGGSASWVFQALLKTLQDEWQGGVLGFLAYTFLGLVAGPIGMYLLANSDTVRQIERTFVSGAFKASFAQEPTSEKLRRAYGILRRFTGGFD